MTDQKLPQALSDDSDPFLQRFLPGSSAALMTLRANVVQLNSTRNRDLIPQVLVLGDSGAGKNHLVKVVAGHRRWVTLRNSGADPGLEAGLDAYADRFYAIHLPALPEQLIESELFGHTKGAFTGAERSKRGLLAGDGADDILLDEIGDITPALQAKLLGVLETRHFRPVGGELNVETGLDARLFMATNRSLTRLVAAGTFRADLYHRMRLLVLRVPSLHEQPENIEPIARRIEGDIRHRLPVNLGRDQQSTPELSHADMAWARSYRWPGNVRELKLAIIRWFFHDGRRTLQEAVEDLRTEVDAPPTARAVEDIGLIVATRLSAALAEGKPAANTLNDLVDDYARQIKGAIATWYRDSRVSGDKLGGLFPGHKSIDSIRNKLSNWRVR